MLMIEEFLIFSFVFVMRNDFFRFYAAFHNLIYLPRLVAKHNAIFGALIKHFEGKMLETPLQIHLMDRISFVG
jgi:hypothetical protein